MTHLLSQLAPLPTGPIAHSHNIFSLATSSQGPVRSILPNDTISLLRRFERQGLPSETIARLLNGTQHTAFIDDMRLARRVVSAGQGEISADPQENQYRRRRFLDVINTAFREKQNLETTLFQALHTLGTKSSRALITDLRRGSVCLKIITDDEMNRLTSPWSRQNDQCVSFYLCHPHQKPQILLRCLPNDVYSVPREKFGLLIIRRILGSIHEWDHNRQKMGHFEHNAPPTHPLHLNRSHKYRHEGLLGEILSLFEEHHLLALMNEDDLLRQASARRETLAQFFHYLAEKSYPLSLSDRLSDGLKKLREWFRSMWAT